MLHESLENFYKGKKVLVTGGAGFIGSHIVEKLVELGAKVTILDNFSTGKINNLYKVIADITVFYSDICASSSTLRATAGQEIVFHLAALASVPQSIQNPKQCHKVNVEGTQNLLDCCHKNNIKTFIFSSSSAVYGNKNGLCQEDSPTAPQSPYAESKLQGENLCKKYAELGMNTASLRYFNVYGERQNPNGYYAAVVAKFKHNLLNNLPITIFGDGHQTRDFIDVNLVANANLEMGTLTGLKGEAINIASGKSINLLELVIQLENELNVKSTEIKFEPARQGDVMFSQASCEKFTSFCKQLKN